MSVYLRKMCVLFFPVACFCLSHFFFQFSRAGWPHVNSYDDIYTDTALHSNLFKFFSLYLVLFFFSLTFHVFQINGQLFIIELARIFSCTDIYIFAQKMRFAEPVFDRVTFCLSLVLLFSAYNLNAFSNNDNI